MKGLQQVALSFLLFGQTLSQEIIQQSPPPAVGTVFIVQHIDLWKKAVTSSWRFEVVDTQENRALMRVELNHSSGRESRSWLRVFDASTQLFSHSTIREGEIESVRFPLQIGKAWSYQYQHVYTPDFQFSALQDMRPQSYNNEMTATVVGWESITVPAGTFRALVIKHDGYWKSLDGSTRGRQEFTFWYSPELSWIVQEEKIGYLNSGQLWTKSQYQLVGVRLPQ